MKSNFTPRTSKSDQCWIPVPGIDDFGGRVSFNYEAGCKKYQRDSLIEEDLKERFFSSIFYCLIGKVNRL
jgi:hypothetical protein